jgi:hypothetical protein
VPDSNNLDTWQQDVTPTSGSASDAPGSGVAPRSEDNDMVQWSPDDSAPQLAVSGVQEQQGVCRPHTRL